VACPLAVFDPAFPGIYPLGVTRPAHARPLFEAIDSHARPPYTNVCVEGDAPLADTLLAAGATPTFENLRMGAALEPR
jgi:hypothetical protein